MYHIVLVPGLVFVYVVPRLLPVSRSEWDLPPQQHVWWMLCLLE